MRQLESARLILRPLRADDAPFIVELLNDPGFLRYIGDRGVRTIVQAHEYIATGPIKSYETNNFGLLLVQAKSGGAPLGMCGLVRRDYFPDPDLGFAFLPQFRAHGYAFEASQAALADGRGTLGYKRVLAIVQPNNAASLKLLHKLGFVQNRVFKLTAEDPELLVLARQTE